jgi:hypothetical protein
MLAPALRDSTAVGLLHALSSIKPTLVDRLALFENQMPLPQLRRETCACIAAALYRAILSGGVEQRRAVSLVEESTRHALAPDVPAREVGHYLGSDSPVRDLCTRLAAVLGAHEEAKAIYFGVTPYFGSLGHELQKVARDIVRLTA